MIQILFASSVTGECSVGDEKPTHCQKPPQCIPGAQLPTDRETVDPRPPDQDALSPETQRLDDIDAGADPAVKQHGDVRSHRLRDLRQHLQTVNRPVQLPAPVVAHHDARDPGGHGHARVVDVLDPLEHDRAVPVPLQQRQLVPGVRRAGEDVGFPFLGGEEDVVFDLLAVFLGEAGAEDGVGEAGLVADAGGEGDVGVVEVGGAPGEGPGIESYD